MAPITGREVVIALKLASVWHTPVACGAGDGLLILSDNIKSTIGMELDDSAGQAWVNQADPGPMQTAGSLEAYMRYEGFDVALALICGIAGTPTLAGVSDAYTNSYKLASDLDGLFATMAMLKLSDKAQVTFMFYPKKVISQNSIFELMVNYSSGIQYPIFARKQ